MRLALAFFCAYCEASFYEAVANKVSRFAGQLVFIFLVVSAGMFNASTGLRSASTLSSCSGNSVLRHVIPSPAFLPSSFCMYFVMLGYTKWITRKKFATIFMFAIGVIYGWPFCGVLGIPVAIDFFLKKKGGIVKLIRDGIVSVVVLVVSSSPSFLLSRAFPDNRLPSTSQPLCITIDWYYYRRIMLVPLNILMYNVFSSDKGPELYGVEPVSFYFVNGFLNFNVLFFLALASLPAVGVATYFSPKILFVVGNKQSLRSFFFQLLPLYVWLAVFFSQPHKEERFLYVVYPLICYHAAICVMALYSLAEGVLKRFFKLSPASTSDLLTSAIYLLIGITTFLSFSRLAAIYVNYHGSLDVYSHLGREVLLPNVTEAGPVTVCVGKEWYRFPSHFFFPSSTVSLGFLKSDFAGQLPQYYGSGDDATYRIPPHMNDMNKEEMSRYVDFHHCDYIVDQTIPGQREPVYTEHGFEEIYCQPFLNPERSPSLTRAFYIPLVSPASNYFNNYCIMQKKLPSPVSTST